MKNLDILTSLHLKIARKINSFLKGGLGFLIFIGVTYLITVAITISGVLILNFFFNEKGIKENFGLVLLLFAILAIVPTYSGIKAVAKSRMIFFKKAMEAKNSTFGKARFAEGFEIKETGLLGDGVVFGKFEKKLVTKPPSIEGHALIVGGTGSGKTRGVIIPTLLKWPGAVIIMDIKGELSRITKDRRSLLGDVFIFDSEGGGDCYDPIALCNTIDQAQDLARTLIPVPENGDPFWCEAAQAILAAFAYEGSVYGYKLSDIAEKLCTTPITELIAHCREHELRHVRLLASITYDTPEKTLGSIMGTLKSKLITIATDDNIRKATRRSDWTPETLETGATIYLKVAEHLLDQYKDIWTIIFNQCLKYLSKREDRKDPPILIGIDELPRLSKIQGLVNALATLRSRNVHILGVIQSMAQLDEIYGKDERKIIADNCRFKLVLGASDPDTQKYFSELAGQRTILAKGTTYGSGLVPNISRNEQGVPLIRPEEWANLEKSILFAPKLQPVPIDLAFWDLEKL